MMDNWSEWLTADRATRNGLCRGDAKMRGASTMCFVFGLWALCALTEGAATSEYLGNNQRTGYADEGMAAAPVLLWTFHESQPPRHA